MDLFIYTTPAAAAVTLTLDSGLEIVASGPIYAHGRADAHVLELPDHTPSQGGQLEIRCDGYQPIAHRGLIVPATTDRADAQFLLDDVHLTEATPEPVPEPPPVYAGTPEEIINQVWATGDHELVTKEGCGVFTEACCTALHDHNHQLWGHIKKNPGQNQWNGHAVDAVQCLAGESAGIWDIIHDSESSNATPACNYKGPADPTLWYYPA